MRKKSKILRCVQIMLCILLLLSLHPSQADAAKKAALKTTKVSMTVGKTKKIKITRKKKGAKYLFYSSGKSKASVSKSGVIRAKKAGKVKITVKEKYKKKIRLLGKVNVTIKKKEVKKDNNSGQNNNNNQNNGNNQNNNNSQNNNGNNNNSNNGNNNNSDNNNGNTTQPEEPTKPEEPAQPDVPEEPESKMKPISEILADTNVDLASGYRDNKSGVTYGEVKDIRYYSSATESMRNAKVILPAGYTTKKKYPVLYLMHGIGGNETTLLYDGVLYTIGNAIASGDAEEMIVVLPNGCANATGTAPENFFSLEHYSAYNNFINDLKNCLMPYMEDNFSIAEGRDNTAIAGFSMGGRVSLQIGFTLPEMFRYVGGFCPAFGILEYENYGVHEDGLFTEDSFKLPDQYKDDTLVLIAAGPNDGIVRDEPKRYHNTLQKNEVPHMYYETLGGDNNTGDGGHSGDVYKHGLYNFMKRIFRQK